MRCASHAATASAHSGSGSVSMSRTPRAAASRASERVVLDCGDRDVALGLVFTAVVSAEPEPSRPEQVRGVFTLRSPTNTLEQALWLYSDEALTLDATCSPPDAGAVAAKLELVPGWNQAVLTGGEAPRLESRAVPAAFRFAE